MLSACLARVRGSTLYIILVVGLVDCGQQAQERAALQALLKSFGCLACSAGVTVPVQRAVAAPRTAGKPENSSQRVVLPDSVINKNRTMNEEKEKINQGSSGEEQKKNNSSLLLFCILVL